MTQAQGRFVRNLMCSLAIAILLLLTYGAIPSEAFAEEGTEPVSEEESLEVPVLVREDEGWDFGENWVPDEEDGLSTQAVTARTSAPAANNTWYYSDTNPYYKYRSLCLAPCGVAIDDIYVTGNCTWYAWGRAAEVLGYAPDIGQYDPVGNWDYVRERIAKSSSYAKKYSVGFTPRAHSLEINSHHIAYVEEVLDDGRYIVSESGYEEKSYWPGFDKVKFHYGVSYNSGIIGYIYLPYPEGYNEPEEPGCFPDIAKSHWANDIIQRSVDLGIFSGYSNGNFGPEDNVTRGQVAVLLWNLADKPWQFSGAKSFSDVQKGAYYYYAVRWASAAHVVSGYGDGTYLPDSYITRQELAVMLWNYARNVEGLNATGSLSNFSSMQDKWYVSKYAREAVGWCFKNGILSGSGGYVNPQNNATRAEAAKMFVKAYDTFA